tara:strand:- start:16431 stop:16997 length:567 start_codon:yes stop_codon:yes gene_type:complete
MSATKTRTNPIEVLDREFLRAGLFRNLPPARRRYAIRWHQAGLTPADFARYHQSVVKRRPRSPAAVMGAEFKDFETLVKTMKYQPEPKPQKPSYFESQLRRLEPSEREAYRRDTALGHMREKVDHCDMTLTDALAYVNTTFQIEISEAEAQAYLDERPGRIKASPRARQAFFQMLKKIKEKNHEDNSN